MSLSNPRLVNPAVRRFEWAGSTGQLQYYDRETKQTYTQPLPFRFIVLDQLNTVTGFSKLDQSRIWANEVRNIKKDEMFTRTSRGPLEAGLYENLTQTVKRGGKFCKSIYIAFELNGSWSIGNFQASGSSATSWFEFLKNYSVEQGMVVMTRGEQMEAQTGPYFPPHYKWEKWDDGAYQICVQLDKQLQVYLGQVLNIQRDEEGREITNEDNGYATEEQKADFEARRAASSTTVGTGSINEHNDVVIEDLGEEPINLDDIPF